MPNKTIDALALCPFYLREDRYTITCEDCLGDECRHKFRHEWQKVAHERDFCAASTWQGCPHALAVKEKYALVDTLGLLTGREKQISFP